MSFKAEIRVAAGWNWDDGAVDNGRLDYAKVLAGGNGENQAEAAWHAENQMLLAGTSLVLDLTALTRTVLGDTNTVTLLTVKALLVVNQSTSDGKLIVGGAATNVWAGPFEADDDQLALPPDGPLLLANRPTGWDVDDSNKHLKLAADGGDVTYSIAILGTTSVAGSGSSGA